MHQKVEPAPAAEQGRLFGVRRQPGGLGHHLIELLKTVCHAQSFLSFRFAFSIPYPVKTGEKIAAPA